MLLTQFEIFLVFKFQIRGKQAFKELEFVEKMLPEFL